MAAGLEVLQKISGFCALISDTSTSLPSLADFHFAWRWDIVALGYRGSELQNHFTLFTVQVPRQRAVSQLFFFCLVALAMNVAWKCLARKLALLLNMHSLLVEK